MKIRVVIGLAFACILSGSPRADAGDGRQRSRLMAPSTGASYQRLFEHSSEEFDSFRDPYLTLEGGLYAGGWKDGPSYFGNILTRISFMSVGMVAGDLAGMGNRVGVHLGWWPLDINGWTLRSEANYMFGGGWALGGGFSVPLDRRLKIRVQWLFPLDDDDTQPALLGGVSYRLF